MSSSLLLLPLSASLILLTDCVEVGTVDLIVAKLVAVGAFCVAEAPLRCLQGDATSHDTSSRVGVGAGEGISVGLRHYPLNVCKVAVLFLKFGLVDSVVLWWKALKDDVHVLAARGALLRCDGIEAVEAPVLLVEKVIGVFVRPHLYCFYF